MHKIHGIAYLLSLVATSPEGGIIVGTRGSPLPGDAAPNAIRSPLDAAGFTVPEAAAFVAELPAARDTGDGIPTGYGLFPPRYSPVVVTLRFGGRRSQDEERQPIPAGAEGWIVALWRVDVRGTPHVRIRIGFHPIPPSTVHRWIDVDDRELGKIPALAGKPRRIGGWELRRLEGAPAHAPTVEEVPDAVRSAHREADRLDEEAARHGEEAAQLARDALDCERAAAMLDSLADQGYTLDPVDPLLLDNGRELSPVLRPALLIPIGVAPEERETERDDTGRDGAPLDVEGE